MRIWSAFLKVCLILEMGSMKKSLNPHSIVKWKYHTLLSYLFLFWEFMWYYLNKYSAVCPCEKWQYYFPFPISSILPIFPCLRALNQSSYLTALLFLHLQNGKTIRCFLHPLGCITCSGNSKTWVQLFQL